MSPQFVDFDADGQLDIVAGIFDGSPHFARGTGKSWQQPESILDREGARIVLNAFWNFDTKKWDETQRCDPAGTPPPKGHLTSAVAFDVDGDGDLDLLLGDHSTGHVYVRTNEGARGAAQFATRNQWLLADGKPIDVPGTVATLRVFDWDRDGRLDLLIGSMGNAYGADGQGGAVLLFPNVGSGKAAEFGAPVTLIAESKKDAIGAPQRPDAGLYMDAGDVDGDGDPDLVVGGYSFWRPAPRELSAAEQQRLSVLRQEIAHLDADLQALNQAAQKFLQGGDEAATRAYSEAFKRQAPQRDANRKAREPIQKELETLAPTPQRRSFTWLYENTTPRAK